MTSTEHVVLPAFVVAGVFAGALGVAGWSAIAVLDVRDRITRAEVVTANLAASQPSMLAVGRELGSITAQLELLTSTTTELSAHVEGLRRPR